MKASTEVIKAAFNKWLVALKEQSQGRAPTKGQLAWHWTSWQVQWRVIEAMQEGKDIPTQFEAEEGTIILR